MPQQTRIIVKCTACGWRLMDKVTPTAGKIQIKCPRCHHVILVDLSLRRGRPMYRTVQPCR